VFLLLGPLPEGRNLLSEILKNLAITQIVIADLTDFNPNVFWELGIRQSFKHGTITIAESKYLSPFRSRQEGYSFLSYARHLLLMNSSGDY